MSSVDRPFSLITGPTSGIGLALAEALARRGDALLLVGRSEQGLNRVAEDLRWRFSVQVQWLLADLAVPEQVERLLQNLSKNGPPIDLLVNNAGFASSGSFVRQPWQQEWQELQVNVLALTRLCHAIGRRMAEAGGGQILNVASTAAFMPGPWMTNYAAGKAYVLHFSEGLREELAPLGVKVSVLCPGTTRTPFFDKARIDVDKAAPAALVMRPEQVAEAALRGLQRNQAVIIPGFINRLLAFSPRLGPRWLARKVTGALYKKVAPPS